MSAENMSTDLPDILCRNNPDNIKLLLCVTNYQSNYNRIQLTRTLKGYIFFVRLNECPN